MSELDFREASGTPVHFPQGLPGFAGELHFRMVEHASLAPLVLLQSEHSAHLCFLTLPVAELAPDYQLTLGEADWDALDLDPAAAAAMSEGLLALAIVTLGEDGPPSANLLAPVVLNLAAGRGVQAVRTDRRYSHQHPIEPAVTGDSTDPAVPADSTNMEEVPCS